MSCIVPPQCPVDIKVKLKRSFSVPRRPREKLHNPSAIARRTWEKLYSFSSVATRPYSKVVEILFSDQ